MKAQYLNIRGEGGLIDGSLPHDGSTGSFIATVQESTNLSRECFLTKSEPEFLGYTTRCGSHDLHLDRGDNPM